MMRPMGLAGPEREARGATTVVAESRRGAQAQEEPAVNVLVIAWCPHEPDRVGEIAVVPPAGAVHVLGRGAEPGAARLHFFRPRPGALHPTPPLAAPGLSRRQLEVEPAADRVAVRRVGQCPMRVNGVECDSATLRPGDTLRFRQELVLYFARRPARISPLQHFDARTARFGEPDAAGILGESPRAWELRDRIAFAAKAEGHVLLVGETGTGKELAARAVALLSARADKPLVARNAATLPGTLVDAELFGNARNYPNPGMGERPGLVGQADGGFLFLDEIGELPTDLQAHLLRTMDAGGEYHRLGESSSRRSDFRLLAATNRDPAELKDDFRARFRVQVPVPALAERREDIPLLVRHLVLRAAAKSPNVAERFVETRAEGEARARVDTSLVDALTRRSFPGNTRELESILWTAMAASRGDVIEWHAAAAERQAAPPPAANAREKPNASRHPEPSEEEIRAALGEANGNVSRAATALGMSSRYALYRLMARMGIQGK